MSRQRVAYLTDVEGNYDYYQNYIKRSSIVEFDSKRNLVFKEEGTLFVYGGDVCDKGMGSIRITKQLVAFKKKYPDRVILILGNRDINKMRFTSELAQTEIDNLDSIPGPYWVKKESQVSPKQFLTKLSEKNNQTVASLNNVANRIKWMLDATMGAAGDFDRRREELAIINKKKSMADISDEQVASSYVDSVKPNGDMYEFLYLGQIAYIHHETLFVHGGVTKANIGYVPFAEERFTSISEWVDSLNAWWKLEFLDWTKQTRWDYPKDTKYFVMKKEKFDVSIQGIPSQEDFEKKSKWQVRGGHRALDYVLPAGKGSVVYANMFNRLNDCQPMDAEVRKQLMDHGIRRVVTGHQPHGNAPAVMKTHDGFEEIDADSSYSDMKAADNRGKAVSEIVIDRQNVYVKGVLENDLTIEYTISLNKGEGDQYVGRSVPLPGDKEGNSFWVKAKLATKPADGKQYLLCKVTGFAVTYDYMSEAKLAEIIYGKKAPETEVDVDAIKVNVGDRHVPVTKIPSVSLSIKEVVSTPFFDEWFRRITNSSDLKLESVAIQSVDVVGIRIRFIKLHAVIRNAAGDLVSGVAFLRGNSVAVLCVLTEAENGQKWVVAVRHPRSPIGTGRHLEIPIGMDEHTNPIGAVRNLLENECGMELENDQLVNLCQHLYGKEQTDRAIFMSPGSCDQGVKYFLLERSISSQQVENIRNKAYSDPLLAPYETVLIKLEDLERECNDATAIVGARLYDLYSKQKRKEHTSQRPIQLSDSVNLSPSFLESPTSSSPELSPKVDSPPQRTVQTGQKLQI